MSHPAGPPFGRFRKSIAKRQTCSPYTSPAQGASVSAYSPITLQWNPACITAELNMLDIYLYDLEAGKSDNGPIFAWKDVPAKTGQFDTEIMANWYNATEAGNESMRLQFVAAGDPAWATTMAVGPTFTVNFNGTAPPKSVTSDPNFDNKVQVAPKKESGVTGGKLGAAVAIPLLAVIACLLGYLFWSRKKSKSASKRWSGVVQKRMSQMSQAPSFANTHARGGSNASYAFSDQRNSFAANTSPLRHSTFFAPTRPSVEMSENNHRASKISFATTLPSPTKFTHNARPSSGVSFPKVGRNGGGSVSSVPADILGPLSPEQDSPSMMQPNDFSRSHRSQKPSMTSSLRNEVNGSTIEGDASCAGALSSIQGKQRLSRLGMEEEVINSSNDLKALAATEEEEGGSNHKRQVSETVSLKMPRMAARDSLSPDQALAAYSQSKNALPITNVKVKKNKLRQFLSTSPSKTSIASAQSTPTMPGDAEDEDKFMTPSQSTNSLTFTPNLLNQPSPALLRPDSTYSTYSHKSSAQNGLGIDASQDLQEDLFFNDASRRSSMMATHSHRASNASGFYAQ